MRLPKSLSLTLILLVLVACGGTQSTVTPVPSAAILPIVATTTAVGTGTALAIIQRTATVDAPVVLLSVSPTPLATTAVTSVVKATPAPTKAAPVAPSPASSRTTPPAATAQAAGTKVERVGDIPLSVPQQTIGAAADGLTLLNVRSGKDDGFTRLVFDLSKQDGSAAPVPRTRLWVQDGTVIVAFGGVRDDAYATSLGSGEERVNLGMVQSVYRIPIRDDASAAYGIVVAWIDARDA